jgi:hypothetical protein
MSKELEIDGEWSEQEEEIIVDQVADILFARGHKKFTINGSMFSMVGP